MGKSYNCGYRDKKNFAKGSKKNKSVLRKNNNFGSRDTDFEDNYNEKYSKFK